MEESIKDLIVKRERENDGRNVYLYYREELGLYVGYGHSAYFTTAVVDPAVSYSDKLDLPVVLLNKQNILRLRQSMTILEHEPYRYYHFQTRNIIGRRWYEVWIKSIKK